MAAVACLGPKTCVLTNSLGASILFFLGLEVRADAVRLLGAVLLVLVLISEASGRVST
jgi:hypothetical protein